MSEPAVAIEGVSKRFGRILASDLEPGLHVRWPWPFESHRLIVQNLAQRLEFDSLLKDRRATASDPPSTTTSPVER